MKLQERHRSIAPWRTATLFAVLLFAICKQSRGQQFSGPKLTVGERIPLLQGVDQFGKKQDFNSLKGPNGLVLLFFRSADW
jgi:hypothetical protein